MKLTISQIKEIIIKLNLDELYRQKLIILNLISISEKKKL